MYILHFKIVLRTLLNKCLSVQYRDVNQRHNVAQQIYRTQASCITETYFLSICDERRAFRIKVKSVNRNSQVFINKCLKELKKYMPSASLKQQSIN